MQRFVVFDVETPNQVCNRMSAIGITLIENGVITKSFYSLVNPETRFDPFNTRLTGIGAETVRGAPTFPQLWTQIEPLLCSGILVAHNAVFDLGVLRCCLRDYGIAWKLQTEYLCTVQIGRRLLPGMRHRLNVLSAYYGIPLEHHNAASDARACAEILLRYQASGADLRQYLKTYTFTRRGGGNMHDIWNPWHGCVKKSEGCDNCYMYYLDRLRDQNGAQIYRTKTNFNYPVQKDKNGDYKIKSGEQIRVCMTSDFFLEEADAWRNDAWNLMRQRRDVVFFLLTKRPERVADHLPDDWGDGWDNIFFNVSAENQRRADERIPILLDLPFKHKGVMCAPFIGEISLRRYLETGQIEQVLCDGENYGGARPCRFEWVRALRQECEDNNVTFVFCGTGRCFVKDGKTYHLEGSIQSRQARKSNLSFQGKPIRFDLYDAWGLPIPETDRYKPSFRLRCETCGMQMICNGCSNCGRCER